VGIIEVDASGVAKERVIVLGIVRIDKWLKFRVLKRSLAKCQAWHRHFDAGIERKHVLWQTEQFHHAGMVNFVDKERSIPAAPGRQSQLQVKPHGAVVHVARGSHLAYQVNGNRRQVGQFKALAPYDAFPERERHPGKRRKCKSVGRKHFLF